MLRIPRFRIVGFQHIWLIILAFVAALSVGSSILLFPYEYTLLFVGGVILGFVVLLIWLNNPSLALCLTLIIIFLPAGLISPTIQSNLNRSLTVITFGIWIIHQLHHKYRIVLTPTSILMIAFLIWCATTFFWSQSIENSSHYVQVYILRFILFLFLLPNMIRTENDFHFFDENLSHYWLVGSFCICC
jgi:hypothetical protein